MKQCIVQVVLDTPLDLCFDYRWPDGILEVASPELGQLVLVPFGRREVVGLVVAIQTETLLPPEKLKVVIAVHTQLAPLSKEWRDLCHFAAQYYQRGMGEVALPCLPKNLRVIKTGALDRALNKIAVQAKSTATDENITASHVLLNGEQQDAVEVITAKAEFAVNVLYGVTGSGKTEVYLQTVARILARTTGAQALILVPEINLTPQLEANIRARFPDVVMVSLHSGLSEGERTRNWLSAHLGHARIILGTRLAVLASMPHLQLIIIDEEHDVSYKQQEGLRYLARDLAVWRAWQLNIPIILGSATPSLETWHHIKTGRYRQLTLSSRAVKDAVLPSVRLINTAQNKLVNGLSQALLDAIKIRLERGEQSLLFLNRRGYAPVITCDACGWMSSCVRCTAFMVVHKPEHHLRCHHCSLMLPVPRSCPTCGNVDLQALGRGTQRIEETLQQVFPTARLMRIDADSTRKKGSAQIAFDTVHRGDVDILIGTQMVAKGHDFKNLTLVGIINSDNVLFSQDYRASERLFAQLMQVAGRAGRTAQKVEGNVSEVYIQTRYPEHMLYAAVVKQDYNYFADQLLKERKSANLPPYFYQAILRVEAKKIENAMIFLQQAATCLSCEGIIINDPIPMAMMRVANVERAQLLIESASRSALQEFLKKWMVLLKQIKPRVTWMVEVDPIDI